MTKPKCVRRGCKKEQKEGSDLCTEHTKKYYEKWTRSPEIPDYGCGGGKRKPRVVGEGNYGQTFHSQKRVDEGLGYEH